jgi:hypothetical protein
VSDSVEADEVELEDPVDRAVRALLAVAPPLSKRQQDRLGVLFDVNLPRPS